MGEANDSWEKCMASLDEAIKYLQECQEKLKKASKNMDKVRSIIR